jgi:hypothetical protein
MAIITKETPVGYSLPEIARQFSTDMFHAGGVKTLHNDQAAAEIEGLSGPIAVGPQVAALIFRMMRLCFEGGWFTGGRSDLIFRRQMGSNEFAVAKGVVKSIEPEDNKLRIICDVWVESKSGEKPIVGTCSGLVPC